jgi:hypothetical protein
MGLATAKAAGDSSGTGSVALRRTKNPSTNDVLSGRGGGANGHPGNIQFRKFVNKRKDEYHSLKDSNSKSQVCREVIAQVYGQTPPGRFLRKESRKTPWWVELDDDRIMAKTAQALRERGSHIVDEVVVKPKKQSAESLPASISSIEVASSAAKSSGRKATASTTMPSVHVTSSDDSGKDTKESTAMLLDPSALAAKDDGVAPTKNKHWTKAEDELLRTAVKQEGAPPYNWQRISEIFYGFRTAKQVRSIGALCGGGC